MIFLQKLQVNKICDFNHTVGTNFPLQSYSKDAQNWLTKFIEIGFSNITNFDWTTLDKESQSGAIILEESITVEAGTNVELYQIVGECGGRNIWTTLVNKIVYPPSNDTQQARKVKLQESRTRATYALSTIGTVLIIIGIIVFLWKKILLKKACKVVVRAFASHFEALGSNYSSTNILYHELIELGPI